MTRPTLQKEPKIFVDHAKAIQDAWHETIDLLASDIASNSQVFGIRDIFHNFSYGTGKLIRPSLFLLHHPDPSPSVMQLAISLELVHLGLMIKNDILRHSARRRGGASLHMLYREFHIEHNLMGDSSAFGHNIALLISDLCISRSEQIWSNPNHQGSFPPVAKEYFESFKESIYWGQYKDLLLPTRHHLASSEDIIAVMKDKCGMATIYYPLMIGSLVAGNDANALLWLEDFAINCGLSYQTTDESIALFKDPLKTGKSPVTDIQQRKETLLLLYAFEVAQPQEQSILQSYYTGIIQEKVVDIQKLLRHPEVERRAKITAEHYHELALAALKRSNLQPSMQQQLRDFADYALKRES